jgi:type III secretion protein J
VRALEAGIRALVAGAADGLDPSAVSIVVAEAPESAPPARTSPRGSRALVVLAGCAALAALAFAVPTVRARLRREVTS